MPFLVGFKNIRIFKWSWHSSQAKSEYDPKKLVCDFCKETKGVFGWKCKRGEDKGKMRYMCADCVYEQKT